jgi:hypothetical protein
MKIHVSEGARRRIDCEVTEEIFIVLCVNVLVKKMGVYRDTIKPVPTISVIVPELFFPIRSDRLL